MDNVDKSHLKSRIGSLVIRKGWVSEAQLGDALAYQQQTGAKLGESLVHLGLIDQKQLKRVLSHQNWSRSTFAGVMMAASQIFISACGGGGGDSDKVEKPAVVETTSPTTPSNPTPPANVAPTVDAGSNQSVDQQENVSLSASASDSDGSIASYQWSQISGQSVTLNNATSAQASFTAPDLADPETAESFEFEITVTDDDGATATSQVSVTVTPEASTPPANLPPTVDAGDNLSVEQEATVNLSANASDPDGTVAGYQWTQISGTQVNISNPTGANASFTAPTLSDPETAESLQFQVTVTDDDGATASSNITVTVNPAEAEENLPPTVDAGDDVEAIEEVEIFMAASATDPDGTIASYQWTQLSGNPVTLNDATSAEASFTTPMLSVAETAENYEFQITVTDDDGATASSSIVVTVTPPVTAGEDCSLTINPGESFTEAFGQMSPGDTLCLNDGKYQQAMDIPSDMNVRAVNDGMAEIDGGGELGEDWSGGLVQMKGNNSSVRGLRVHHASTNADACHIAGTNHSMKFMSCAHGGAHKHKIPLKMGGSGHLIEDSWAFGEGRYVVQCFLGDHITIRRTVARWDSTAPNNPTEPNAAFSIYNCSDVTVENNISLDYGTPETEMRFGGDFYSPHNNGIYPELNHDNHFLGNIVLNHSPDTLNNRAFRADTTANVTIPGVIIKDFYMRDSETDFAVHPSYDISVSKCTRENVINESEEFTCNNDADIAVRYVDGTKTTEALFPFSHEELIKRDMCASGERQSDWCTTTKSLEDYVMNK